MTVGRIIEIGGWVLPKVPSLGYSHELGQALELALARA